MGMMKFFAAIPIAFHLPLQLFQTVREEHSHLEDQVSAVHQTRFQYAQMHGAKVYRNGDIDGDGDSDGDGDGDLDCEVSLCIPRSSQRSPRDTNECLL